MRGKTVGVVIHPKTYEDLIKLHARTGESISTIMRRALVQYLTEQLEEK
jgi:hypothetical protein